MGLNSDSTLHNSHTSLLLGRAFTGIKHLVHFSMLIQFLILFLFLSSRSHFGRVICILGLFVCFYYYYFIHDTQKLFLKSVFVVFECVSMCSNVWEHTYVCRHLEVRGWFEMSSWIVLSLSSG